MILRSPLKGVSYINQLLYQLVVISVSLGSMEPLCHLTLHKLYLHVIFITLVAVPPCMNVRSSPPARAPCTLLLRILGNKLKNSSGYFDVFIRNFVCMCGCFGNMCTCIYCVVYCLYCVFRIFSFMYIYSYLFCLYQCKDYCHRVTTQLQ